MIKINIKRLIYLVILLMLARNSQAGDASGNLAGQIWDQTSGEVLIGANIIIVGTTLGVAADKEGFFYLSGIPVGSYQIQIQYIGYQTKEMTIDIEAGKTTRIDIQLVSEALTSETIVVTATRTDRKRRDAPVIVNVLDEVVFDNTQSLSLAEGIGFQAGVRLEVDCQTCNYTQIRMNGLGGSYSQILIDSRPVFSSLNGLYGLDYTPTNMIERVETIRGGGSALFGSSAIGGVVNIITKEARENRFDFSLTNA